MAAIENFRKNLRREAEAQGMTHRELARRAKIHFTTLSRILNGNNSPTIPAAERLAKAVGIPLEKILS